ncbi:MAG: DNA polymerase IV [Ruminococcaceae bacterium]|nr:DNA polymerase IV [Oscillospiraceae bacterium]
MDRLVFHIDVNSAFLSWEAARRVSNGEADIRLIPSAIGGDREKRTGVILAKSIPAKKCGIKTGEPVGMALRKCPSLFLARPDFRLYEKCSEAFIAICKEYAPVVEKFSIDECFLDMSGTSNIYPDPIAVAYEIKDKIKNKLGFTVNVGIGPNKLLAKMASDFEKPDKVHTLFKNELAEKFWKLPVRELFGVGASTADKLERACVHTIGELAQLDMHILQSLVGNKTGAHLHAFANGIDDSPVCDQPEKAKGYSNSTTLENDVTSFEEACAILLSLADVTAARMRSDGARAYCVGVTIRDNGFRDSSHQRRLENATDITSEIFAVCRSLFSELWDRKTPLRLLGISLTNVTEEADAQLSFFDDEKRDRARAIDKAVDEIRTKYGSATITRGFNYSIDSKIGRKHKAQMENKNKEKN